MTKITDKKIKKVKQLLAKNRIKILALLLERDTCVCEMVKALDLKHSLLSHHLKKLLDMEYLTFNKNGQHVIYTLEKSKRKLVQELIDVIKNN